MNSTPSFPIDSSHSVVLKQASASFAIWSSMAFHAVRIISLTVSALSSIWLANFAEARVVQVRPTRGHKGRIRGLASRTFRYSNFRPSAEDAAVPATPRYSGLAGLRMLALQAAVTIPNDPKWPIHSNTPPWKGDDR
jgi:hypothetical protein